MPTSKRSIPTPAVQRLSPKTFMTNAALLYRFRIDLSDVDRGVYEQLDFRVSLHPSESVGYMLTRVLAYALNYEDGIQFSAMGLGDPDGPAILIPGNNGNVDLWIEIGNPSAKKLHRASKAVNRLKVYTHKNPRGIFEEAESREIHRAAEIEIYAFPQAFLERLGTDLPRDVRWQVLHHERLLTVSGADKNEQVELTRLQLS